MSNVNASAIAENSPEKDVWWPTFGAWLIALISTLGALYIGEILGRSPCVLCWYQRIAMFPMAVILGIACYRDDKDAIYYALPLAIVGGGIALWHTLVYFGFAPQAIQPCSEGVSCSGSNMVILGTLPLPVLSFGAFLGITLLLFQIKIKRQK